jgi:membrane protease YdiL (CAAX protease family)
LEGFGINYLIPPLDSVLLVIASLYPTGFCANLTALLKGPRNFGQSKSLTSDLAGFLLGYAAVIVVVALVRPGQVLLFILPTSLPLFFLAPFVGLACIALEYLTGILLLFVRTHRLVTRVTVHTTYAAVSRISITDILAILALVVGEELILRQFLYNLLVTDFALGLWIALLVCAAAYALNHLGFGGVSVISKLPSGLIYILLFYASGLSIPVVMVAHATQNLALLALSRTRL